MSTVRLYVVHLASQHLLLETKRQAETVAFGRVSRVIDATRVRMCKRQRGRVWLVFPLMANLLPLACRCGVSSLAPVLDARGWA